MESDSLPKETSEEIAGIKATFPNRCRITWDVGQYKTVISLQPENMDATVKFHLTPAYPSVIPDIKIRSESLQEEDIQQLQELLKIHAKNLTGKAMIQSLMEEAKNGLKSLGMKPGKVKTVHTDYLLDDKRNRNQRKNRNRSKKSKSKSENEEEYEKKLPPMKTAEDVVKRIIWDEHLDSDQFLVGYVDRFLGLMEKYFTAFSWEDIATVDYDVLAIPKHRIQYFKYKDVKIWDKTKRMDNVFGSANGTKTIDVVIKEVEETEQEQRQNWQGEGAESSPHYCHKSEEDDDSDDSSDDEDFINVTISSSVNIGVPKSADDRLEEMRDPEKQLDENYWTDKLRPNYFVCVRITDPRIIEGIGNVQDSLLQKEPLLAECCIPGASLHITITCIGLDTSEQLLQCMEALKKIQPDLENVLPKSTLKLKGVSNFYSRVLYAKVNYEKDFTDFCDFLRLNLQEAGVSIRDGYEFVPHATIVKTTRPVSRARGTKDIDSKYYTQYTETEFGEQLVDSIYLCSMGPGRRPDGFYLTPLELHFNHSN